MSGCSCKAAPHLQPTLPCIPSCATLMDAEQHPHCPSKTTEPQFLPQVLKSRGNLNHMPSGEDKLKYFAEHRHQQVLSMPNSTYSSHSWLHHYFSVFPNWNLCCCPILQGNQGTVICQFHDSMLCPKCCAEKNDGWGALSWALCCHKSSHLQGYIMPLCSFRTALAGSELLSQWKNHFRDLKKSSRFMRITPLWPLQQLCK